MSVEGEKGGGRLGKKVNSEFEGEKWVREREKIGFCILAANWFENKAKRSGSGLATSPLSELIKIKPLGRFTPSVRADHISNLNFR